MDTLRAAVVVLRVAEAGSFAGAARLPGVPSAAAVGTWRVMPWLFGTPGGTRRLQPDFALVVDGSDALRAATAPGAGIAQAGTEGTAALLACGGHGGVRRSVPAAGHAAACRPSGSTRDRKMTRFAAGTGT